MNYKGETYLTFTKAAEHLQISRGSLYKLVNDKKIKTHKVLGKRYIKQSEI